ncbi:MAG: glycoside hydrolase [Lacrimispora celerecrescens]|nr:glycoside hydrolase [Lacrimispora celerecrescens]
MKVLRLSKDQRKAVRSVIQAIILAALLVLLFRAFFVVEKYIPFQEGDGLKQGDPGFIALSYFGVDRAGTSSLISTQRLEEHMNALKRNGYVTISQKDMMEYYEKDIPLPENSLFLMFEDGRRDTAVYSAKILEKYNYLATILSYGQKLEGKDDAFLMPEDLKKLKKSSFWEWGTNGYRLSYINVFDRYDHYLGELNLQEFNYMSQYLGRNYNQYLMDYIRDEEAIPKETPEQMRERISKDYQLMKNLYTKELGELPDLYVLMHANTGRFGNHEKVSEVNEKWIKELFSMNFNREGDSKNNRETNPYDLTRLQPQAYWYPNHLLMRIKADTGKDMIFEEGDEKRKADWEILKGAVEFRDSQIILTSEPEGNGLLRLEGSRTFRDLSLSADFTGNILGIQRIWLRTGDAPEKAVIVEVKNNVLSVYDNGSSICEINLAEFDGKVFKTVREDELEALKGADTLYKKNSQLSYPIEKVEEEIRQKEESDLPDRDYVPDYQINETGSRKLDIVLKGSHLSVNIDGRNAVSDLSVSNVEAGALCLESAFENFGYSQRNIADDVYDGVFENLVIRDSSGNILYDNRLKEGERAFYEIRETWNRVINWFIKAL